METGTNNKIRFKIKNEREWVLVSFRAQSGKEKKIFRSERCAFRSVIAPNLIPTGYPTGPLTILEPHDQDIGKTNVVQQRRTTKIVKGSVGCNRHSREYIRGSGFGTRPSGDFSIFSKKQIFRMIF